MNVHVYNKSKENAARALGISVFSDAAKKGDLERATMISNARKNLKFKCRTITRDLSSGNPYIMLGRKVNSKGKRVK